jgi:hypothetical protein
VKYYIQLIPQFISRTDKNIKFSLFFVYKTSKQSCTDEKYRDFFFSCLRHLGESEGAEPALVGLLSRVNPQVFRQRGGIRERFLAHATPGIPAKMCYLLSGQYVTE